jgi:hypothetical protein
MTERSNFGEILEYRRAGVIDPTEAFRSATRKQGFLQYIQDTSPEQDFV